MRVRVTMLSAILAAIGVALAAETTSNKPRAVDFSHDVAPLLEKHCQECHRPGEIGPMPLLNYQQVRPWAKAIRAAVLQRVMPPWHADPHFGKFSNDRSLSQGDIDTIVSWVDGGSIEGNPADAPKPREFSDEWRIGTPDVVFEMPREFHVPAAGVVEYQWIKIPSGFAEDKWVEAVEVRPGNPAVVHHAVVYAREPGLTYAKEAKYNEFFQLSGEDIVDVLKNRSKGDTMFSSNAEPEHLQVFAPGADPILLGPGQARLVKAGSDIVFEMHYTPNGTAATDRTRIGLRFARKPPVERVRTVRINNGVPLIIPPGDASYRLESRVEALAPVKIVSFMPHMHLRGKSMEFRVSYPTGESETLLSVPRYDFHWQMTYYLKEPKILPKGTIITCIAVYDNSPNNRYNPDPQAVVKGGRQSWEEMMAGFVDFGIGPNQSLDLFHDAPGAIVEAQR